MTKELDIIYALILITFIMFIVVLSNYKSEQKCFENGSYYQGHKLEYGIISKCGYWDKEGSFKKWIAK